jgi:glycerol-3-phosphate dehydrogenase
VSAAVPSPVDRAAALERLARSAAAPFDLVVVGGGATGLGVAVDAAARGFSVALVEADDFAKGTSSRATKLIHGGVRYLAQGDLRLVREALAERALLLANAPHLAGPLDFLVPAYGLRGRLWDRWKYAAGLFLYDRLAGRAGLGRTRLVGRGGALERAPGLRRQRPAEGLVGAVCYVDGQCDDARLAVALARTAAREGACVVNHCRVVSVAAGGGGGRLAGVEVEDRETGRRIAVAARCIVNATGVWVDDLRRLETPSLPALLAPSQGAHLVVDREFFPGATALLVPRTADGRVLFAVPWLGSVVLGTTDTPRADRPLEPRPLAGEIDFILREAGRYLARAPTRADVRSAWAGLRPLVRPAGGPRDTKAISREHAIVVSPGGMVTVTGGKWTTYRAMAEDVLAACAHAGLLAARPAGATRHLRLVGAPAPGTPTVPLSAPPGLHLYGSEADGVCALPGAGREILPGLSEAMVRFAVRHEFARTVEDVLARRARHLFLDAAAAAAAAADVAAVVKAERGPGFDAAASAAAFAALARSYLPDPVPAG